MGKQISGNANRGNVDFSLAACGDGKKTDKNKSQIYVGVFNAGIGYTWLEELAERFETAYADTSFEDGKTGVQVFIDPQATYWEFRSAILCRQTKTA